MKRKFFETTLEKSINLENLRKTIAKELEAGYFHKWGDFEYCWEREDVLSIASKNWSGKFIFLETKLKVDLNLPIVHKIPGGEIVFSENKGLACYADIPFWLKPLAIPIIKQITEEIVKLA